MSELKPCPFCGCELLRHDDPADFYVRRYGTHYEHPSNDCYLSGGEVSPSEVEGWNRRGDARPETVRYWLCCGSTDPHHRSFAHSCIEAKRGHPERCRFGTKDEHSQWQLERRSLEPSTKGPT